jgi:hypothetical protein
MFAKIKAFFRANANAPIAVIILPYVMTFLQQANGFTALNVESPETW